MAGPRPIRWNGSRNRNELDETDSSDRRGSRASPAVWAKACRIAVRSARRVGRLRALRVCSTVHVEDRSALHAVVYGGEGGYSAGLSDCTYDEQPRTVHGFTIACAESRLPRSIKPEPHRPSDQTRDRLRVLRGKEKARGGPTSPCLRRHHALGEPRFARMRRSKVAFWVTHPKSMDDFRRRSAGLACKTAAVAPPEVAALLRSPAAPSRWGLFFMRRPNPPQTSEWKLQ